MATKVSIAAAVYTKGGFEAIIDDAVIPGGGTGVLGAVQAGRDVLAGPIEGSMIFIPYGAIDHVLITKTSETVDPPEDDTCVVETEEEPTPDPEPTPGP